MPPRSTSAAGSQLPPLGLGRLGVSELTTTLLFGEQEVDGFDTASDGPAAAPEANETVPSIGRIVHHSSRRRVARPGFRYERTGNRDRLILDETSPLGLLLRVIWNNTGELRFDPITQRALEQALQSALGHPVHPPGRPKLARCLTWARPDAPPGQAPRATPLPDFRPRYKRHPARLCLSASTPRKTATAYLVSLILVAGFLYTLIEVLNARRNAAHTTAFVCASLAVIGTTIAVAIRILACLIHMKQKYGCRIPHSIERDQEEGRIAAALTSGDLTVPGYERLHEAVRRIGNLVQHARLQGLALDNVRHYAEALIDSVAAQARTPAMRAALEGPARGLFIAIAIDRQSPFLLRRVAGAGRVIPSFLSSPRGSSLWCLGRLMEAGSTLEDALERMPANLHKRRALECQALMGPPENAPQLIDILESMAEPTDDAAADLRRLHDQRELLIQSGALPSCEPDREGLFVLPGVGIVPDDALPENERLRLWTQGLKTPSVAMQFAALLVNALKSMPLDAGQRWMLEALGSNPRPEIVRHLRDELPELMPPLRELLQEGPALLDLRTRHALAPESFDDHGRLRPEGLSDRFWRAFRRFLRSDLDAPPVHGMRGLLALDSEATGAEERTLLAELVYWELKSSWWQLSPSARRRMSHYIEAWGSEQLMGQSASLRALDQTPVILSAML